jgi:hypothetical protein
MSLNSISRIEKELSEESCHGVRAVMCCSLNCCEHFPHQMTKNIKHKFWNKSFEKRSTRMLDIPRRLHGRGNCNCTKFVTFQKRDIWKIAWYKIMGISRSIYKNYK